MKFLEFSSLYDLLEAFPTEESCIVYLERLRWNGDVRSPFEPQRSKVYVCKNHRYKCDLSNKYFNVRTGSIFADSKLPLRKWLMAIYIFTTHKKGISSYQLARDLSITQKTGWFVLHRLRYAMSHKGLFEYYNTGEFEVDEAYIGGKLENKHRQGKDTHGLEGFKPRTQAIVFGMVQRGGNVYLTHIPKANKKTIEPIIAKVANKGSVINSDEHSAYGLLSKNYVHQTVIHSNWEYVRGSVHTNTIEGVWSLLKRGIYGIYHQTSKKHLQAYCDEFSFRHNRRKYSEYNKVNACLLASTKGSLKYKTLVNKGGENAQI